MMDMGRLAAKAGESGNPSVSRIAADSSLYTREPLKAGAEVLLEALKTDSMARLRHHILRREGISPFCLRARLISDREVVTQACHLVLDGEEIPPAAARHPPFDKGGKAERGESFDMERFLQMKEGGNEAV